MVVALLARMQRRDFCIHACQLVGLGALGAVTPACGGSPTSPSSSAPSLPTISGAIANGKIALTIDTASALNNVGSAALVTASGQNFLVARTAQATFVALTAICTHEQCTVSGFQNSTYVCPCHGSTYSTSGAVLLGPAPRALQQFATSFAGTTLTITVA
jgi:Rieske Fe-S protein